MYLYFACKIQQKLYIIYVANIIAARRIAVPGKEENSVKKLYAQFGYEATLPPRSYYIPFADKEEWNEDRTQSSRFMSLCGNWKIRAYKSPEAAEAADFLANEPEKDIVVPSCVQYYGLDYFQYTNVNYPIPFDPPYVPTENPTYHYSRRFNVKKSGSQYILFEGVDSCFYLYVNDKYVGFSQISHRVSEFDISEYIVDGENKLDVLVLKWCAGTYFEDQDKWRFTGIFRDVYLLTRPQQHIVDYKIETKADGEVTFRLMEGISALVTFEGMTKSVRQGETIAFKVSDPHLWSAETPYLYDMDITANGEFIREKVGIREITIKDGVFLLNNMPIKLRGVNRHDFHPQKGAAVSLDDIMTDLKLMKQLNVNAIRTSHYPSCPQFYHLCDKYGFYVLDEADLETHGCVCGELNRPEGYIAQQPEYEYAMVERQKMLVTRDKNRACVIIWSMGNECGWGRNFYACSAFIKSSDSTRPVHYERVTAKHYDGKRNKYVPNFEDMYTAPVDFTSRMYASPEFMATDYLNDEKDTRPFVQCEYSHAMGNGPGDLKDYWDVIYSSDRFTGGFIWEWADHGVLYGTKGFRYGGDFGETLHDGEFCIDGIVAPDRKIKTGTLEMKKAYEPVKIELDDDNIVIVSREYFASLAFTAEITVKQRSGRVMTQKEQIALEPGGSVAIPVDTDGARLVEVSLRYLTDDGLITTGSEFARAGFDFPSDLRETLTPCPVVMQMQPDKIVVKAGVNEYTIDAGTGEILSVNHGGVNVFADKITLNVYRAYTDNDRNIKNDWKNQRLHLSRQDAYSVAATGEDEITVTGKIASEKRDPAVKFVMKYKFFAEGVKTSIEYDYTPLKKSVFLPRIGLMTKLNKNYEDIEFYGYGPQESYIDKRYACIRDIYKTTVGDNFVHYIRSQENGSHYGTLYAEITDGKTTVRLQNGTGFSFCASPYSIKTIEDARHDDSLPESDATYLYADFYMSGIGSNSCGPELNAKYRTPDSGKGEVDIIIK